MPIERVLRGIVLTGIFVLPFTVFIVAQSLFFPFITGKNFAFRIIVEIISAAYLALSLLNPSYRPRRSWLLGAFAFLIAVVALADALGVYPFKSFWSNYERMDGWVTLAHLFLYFVVASSILNTERLWRAFWHTSLAVSALVGLYGLLQLAGIASLNPGFSSASRIDATFGNPIYLAVFMLFQVGIASTLWARVWQEERSGRFAWSVVYGGLIALDTLILFLTGTRGAILGLVGGAILGAVLIAWSSREGRRVALSMIVVLAVLAGGLYLVRDQSWVGRVPFLQRLATISLEDSTTKARFMNWGMAWNGVKERPLLGWGQENYAIVFDKYYNPRMYGQEQWFDRVHNAVFDWLVAAGFVGLISYLSLFACALWCLWRPSVERGSAEANTPNVRSAFSLYERSILTGLLAAYFFHNLFVFDNISSYMLFATVLAFIVWRSSGGAATLPLPTFPRTMTFVPVVGSIVLLWGASWYVNAEPLIASRTLIKALQPQQAGLSKNLEYFKQSIAYGSLGTQEAREQLVQISAQIIRAENVPTDMKTAFLTTAAQEMLLQANAAPLDARFPLFLGALLNAAGDFENASRALQKAHELSPGKQTILFELAANGIARGDVAAGLAAYKKALELAPEFLDARLYYAAAAIRADRGALADEILAPVIENGGAADPRIAAAYVAARRYDKIIKIWEARVRAMPEEVQGHLTLAAAYYKVKNSSQAIRTLEELAAKVPTAKAQADSLIAQIRGGTLLTE